MTPDPRLHDPHPRSGDWPSERARLLEGIPRACECDDCECHDRADREYDYDPVGGYPGGWLCWNCAVGQHHEHDPLWCAP